MLNERFPGSLAFESNSRDGGNRPLRRACYNDGGDQKGTGMGRIWKAAIIIGAIYVHSPVTNSGDAASATEAAIAMATPAVTEGIRQGITAAGERGLVPIPASLAAPVATAIVAEAGRRAREAYATPIADSAMPAAGNAHAAQARAPLPPRRPAS